MSETRAGVRAWLSRFIQVTAQSALTFFGAVLLLHLLVAFAPGDAIDALSISHELREVVAQEWGLDKSIGQRIWHQLISTAQLDFGTSLVVSPGASVWELMLGPGLFSAALIGVSVLLTLVVASMLAWLTALKGIPQRRFVWLQALSTLPIFLVGVIGIHSLNALVWWAMEANWIERPSFFALPSEPSWFLYLLAVLALAICSGTLADTHQALHHALEKIQASPYVSASRAQQRPLRPHFVGNMMIPLSSVVVARIPLWIGSLIILDPIFNLNGLGRLFWRAAEARDFPLLVGVGAVAVTLIIIGRWLGQTMEFTIDKRRQGGRIAT